MLLKCCMQTLAKKCFCLLHLFKTKNHDCRQKQLGAYIKDFVAAIVRNVSYFQLGQTKQGSGWKQFTNRWQRHQVVRGGSRGGGMQGVRAIPLTFWDEAFSFVFAFKICLPHQSVTPFVDGAPLLRNLLDPPLLYMYFWQKNNFQGIIYYGKNYYLSEQIKNLLKLCDASKLIKLSDAFVHTRTKKWHFSIKTMQQRWVQFLK